MKENYKMMIIDRIECVSVSDVASLLGIDYVLYYGQFLDDFRHTKQESKSLLINEPVVCASDRPDYYDAFLAGVCESLAKEADIPVPGWVYENRYYWKDPVFPFNTENPDFQEYLLETTPEEFRVRNIYFGDSLMSRV